MEKLCATCLLGLESFVADELKYLKFKDVAAENGRVFFSGDESEIARANINLRCAERVLVCVGQFEAKSFEQLFEEVKALPWEKYIPENAAFPVRGSSLSSALHSVPDCQKIIKKAIVERLRQKYHKSWFDETAEKYQVQFALLKDQATVYIDTSGDALYKRGYRAEAGAAPLRETLAAAMVKAARFKGRESFADPFCGSGTIAIEAALAAKNRAPGINRHFAAESWRGIAEKIWREQRQSAREREYSGSYEILGTDIDPACIELARRNAKLAGVDDCVSFGCADALDFESEEPGGLIVTNPPYGERLLDVRQAEEIYRRFGKSFSKLDGWKLYLLSPDLDFERIFGKRAVKKRKLYNGMIQCNLYMYY